MGVWEVGAGCGVRARGGVEGMGEYGGWEVEDGDEAQKPDGDCVSAKMSRLTILAMSSSEAAKPTPE